MQALRALAVALLLLVAAPVAGCGSDEPRQDDAVVRGGRMAIYSSQPLSGYQAARARDVVDAQRLALREAQGRAGRWRIVHVPLDNADPRTGLWSPALVAANARRAAQDPRAIAYLGEMDAGASAVAIPILNERGLLAISPLDGVPGLTRRAGAGQGEPEKYYPTRRRSFARLVPPDDVQAAALVALMQDEGATRLYLTHDDSLYGRSLARNLEQRARLGGVVVVADRGIAPRAADPRAIAADVARSRADAFIYAGQLQPGVGLLYRSVHAADRRARLLAPTALAQPAFISLLGAAQGSMRVVSPVLPPEVRGPEAQSFARRFRAAYGRAPDPAAAHGYETMAATLQAIRRAGADGNRRRAVGASVLRLRDRSSVLGRYDMDPSGDPSFQTFGAYRIRAGRLAFDRVLDPLGA